jgi:hypothetical protein
VNLLEGLVTTTSGTIPKRLRHRGAAPIPCVPAVYCFLPAGTRLVPPLFGCRHCSAATALLTIGHPSLGRRRTDADLGTYERHFRGS